MIRKATALDAPAIVDLAEQRRIQYEQYQPVFWRKAPDSKEQQLPFLTAMLGRENVFALVHEQAGQVNGFLIAALVPSPPVYSPGGPTCSIDDYWIADQQEWEGVGTSLLAAAAAEAKARGAAQMVVVCANRDVPKRTMLGGADFTIASEWWVKSL